MTEAEAIQLIELENIDQAKVIALRRAKCGFYVLPDGTEHKLNATCQHLRDPGEAPQAGGSLITRAKRQIGSRIAKARSVHWCGACGCPLAKKTMVGFDPITSQPELYERLRCPLKQW